MPKSESTLPPPTLLAELAARGDVREVPTGTVLVTEGEQDDRLFVLIDGRMKVFTRDSRNREFVYNVMHAGEIFGELGLDGGRRSASVAALEPCRCVEVRRSELRAFMQSHPEFAEVMVMVLIGRLRLATRQTRRLALGDVYERIVEAFRADAVVERGQRVLPTLLTQKDIAARVGATREMVGHIVRDLERGGFLGRDASKRFVIRKEFPKRW